MIGNFRQGTFGDLCNKEALPRQPKLALLSALDVLIPFQSMSLTFPIEMIALEWKGGQKRHEFLARFRVCRC